MPSDRCQILADSLAKFLEASKLVDAGTLAFLHANLCGLPTDIPHDHKGSADEKNGHATCSACATALIMVRAVALGVGACPECWGENNACRLCSGLGKPGVFVPETKSFDRIIRPALASIDATDKKD